MKTGDEMDTSEYQRNKIYITQDLNRMQTGNKRETNELQQIEKKVSAHRSFDFPVKCDLGFRH